MTHSRSTLRFLALSAALGALSACSTSELDWDLRPDGNGAFSTAEAARQATANRPAPDARGVISYPGYQVAVARRGDTVASVAARVGLPPQELASYNAVSPDSVLNAGEVLALPQRVASTAPGAAPAAGVGTPIQSGTIEVTTLASGAIDRAQASGQTGTAAAPSPIAPGGVEPIRHRVARGETAFSIARLYNVSAKSLAEWNGLGPDLAVREGQYLLIPVALEPAPTEPLTQPGAGTPTPQPPSAAKPLPEEKVAPAAEPAPETPASPELGEQRTAASATKFVLPASGSIIRGFDGNRNKGIDIGAPAGSPVKAADAGTVAALTVDTNQVPTLILRHEGNILTVYANIDGISVKKGDKVSRGQTIAKVRAVNPAFLHFEVRKGVDAVDPMPYLE
jgi:murein DD-endopeptidase MepM/ murein hydrolase activator NlpD